MNRYVYILLLSALSLTVLAQNKEQYELAFNEIVDMLDGRKELSFKRAVFLTENAYYGGERNYSDFCNQIDEIEKNLYNFIQYRNIGDNPLSKQYSVYSFMMEPTQFNDSSVFYYDFNDIAGRREYSQMFVEKLLRTKKGNCHSMPYLYKILANEMGTEAYLAMAPNHIYVMHKDGEGGWVNLELTNGGFPRDAWIISSMDITVEAIRNGIYMRALTEKETVALTIYDLTLQYRFQFGDDETNQKYCDSLISYFPTCVPAYMIKSQMLVDKRKEMLTQNGNIRDIHIHYIENKVMELYATIDNLGHKDMSIEKYVNWLEEVEKEKQKQENTTNSIISDKTMP